MTRTNRSYPIDTKIAALNDSDNGVPTAEIVEKYGLPSSKTLWTWRHRADAIREKAAGSVKPRTFRVTQPGIRKDAVRRIIIGHQERLGIANECGVTRSAVDLWVKKYRAEILREAHGAKPSEPGESDTSVIQARMNAAAGMLRQADKWLDSNAGTRTLKSRDPAHKLASLALDVLEGKLTY